MSDVTAQEDQATTSDVVSEEDAGVKLENILKKFEKIFIQLDSDNEHVAALAWKKVKEYFPKLNELAKAVTGQDPELSFGTIFQMANSSSDVDPAEVEALRKQNEELWVANENHVLAQDVLKEKLSNIDNYIEAEYERRAEVVNQKAEQQHRVDEDKIQRLQLQVMGLSAQLHHKEEEFTRLKGEIPAYVASQNAERKSYTNVKYSADRRSMQWSDIDIETGAILEISRFIDGKRHGIRKINRPDGAPLLVENYEHGELQGERLKYSEEGWLHIRENYNNGRLQGTRLQYNKDETVLVREGYESGRLQGLRTEYNDDDSVQVQENYEEGWLHGNRKVFYSSGKPSLDENYEVGKLAGKREAFHLNGLVSCSENYKDGKLQGPRKTFDAEGKALSLGFYAAGLPDGYHTEYNPATGLPITEEYYQSGRLHGISRKYSAMGKRLLFAFYEHGQLHGKRTEYDRDGFRKTESDYFQGQLHGRHKTYSMTGCLDEGYASGVLHGTTVCYDANERLQYEKIYDRSKLQSEILYNNNKLKKLHYIYDTVTSALIEEGHYQYGELSKKRTYYTGGQLQAETHYLEGKKHGKHTEYHQFGLPNAVALECEYQNDQLQGEYTTYYSNGEIASSLVYVDDEKVKEILYRTDGTPQQEENYKDGKKNGKQIFYTDNGFAIKSDSYKDDVLHGPCESYDPNTENLLYKADYKNGLLDGWQSLYNDGKISSQTQFHHDMRHGVDLRFGNDGHLICQRYFKENQESYWDAKIFQSKLTLVQWGDNLKELFVKNKRDRSMDQRNADQLKKLGLQ